VAKGENKIKTNTQKNVVQHLQRRRIERKEKKSDREGDRGKRKKSFVVDFTIERERKFFNVIFILFLLLLFFRIFILKSSSLFLC
jgi:hypothetical protein